MKFKQFKLSVKKSANNSHTLTPLELKDYIDFEVKRVYFLTDFTGTETGQHCHYTERELFVVIKGTATAVIDQGNGIEDINLGPDDAIYCANYVWHGFKDVSPDATILALSSTNYNPQRTDYLDNYEEYLKIRDKELAS